MSPVPAASTDKKTFVHPPYQPPPVNLATFPAQRPHADLLILLPEPADYLRNPTASPTQKVTMGQTALTSPHLIMLGQAPLGKLFVVDLIFAFFFLIGKHLVVNTSKKAPSHAVLLKGSP